MHIRIFDSNTIHKRKDGTLTEMEFLEKLLKLDN